MSTSTTDVTPSGWTVLYNNTTTGIRHKMFGKSLVAGDLGSTITGMNGLWQAIFYRPNSGSRIANVVMTQLQEQAITTGNPTSYTWTPTAANVPMIVIATYGSTSWSSITFQANSAGPTYGFSAGTVSSPNGTYTAAYGYGTGTTPPVWFAATGAGGSGASTIFATGALTVRV
jgi:hypothetical protein